MPERIGAGVERLGISVAKLAFLVNQRRINDGAEPMSEQGIGLWVRGQREPSAEDEIRLAKVLDCDPGWLRFGSASKAPAPKWLTESTTQKKPMGATIGTAARVMRSVSKKRGKGQEGTG